MLLRPEHFDLWIQAELKANFLGAKLCFVDSLEFDFINELLQANHMAPFLQEHREKAKNVASPWSFENGLLKHWEQLTVTKE